MPLDKIVGVVGKSLLVDRSKPAFLDLGSLRGNGVYLQVTGDDIATGHDTLVRAQVFSDISPKEAFGSIVDTEEMQIVLGFLYKNYNVGRTMLSYLIITGLWDLNRKSLVELPFLNTTKLTLEAKLNENPCFSQKELGSMTNAVLDRVPIRDKSTIQSWVANETIAPIELDYPPGFFKTSALDQLSAVNPEFKQWDQEAGRFDSRAFPLDVRAAYWTYRNLVSMIVGYARRGEINIKDSETHRYLTAATGRERRRPIQDYNQEVLSKLVKFFIGRRTEKYASPRVLKTGSVDGSTNEQYPLEQATSTSRRPGPRLYRGIVTQFPNDFDGKVITVSDLFTDREAVREALAGIVIDYLERHKERYESLYSNLFKQLNTFSDVPVHVDCLDLVLGDLLLQYDPSNPHNDTYLLREKLVKPDSRRLYKQAHAFAVVLIEKIRSLDLDGHHGTGSQINACVDISVKMRDALPYNVHLWTATLDQGIHDELTAEINRKYGVKIQQNSKMFAEQVRDSIRAGELYTRQLGYGIPAFNFLTTDPVMRQGLHNAKRELISKGHNFLNRVQVLDVLEDYGIPDLMRFVHEFNFTDNLRLRYS